MVSILLSVALTLQSAASPVKEMLFSVDLQDPLVHHLHFASSVVVGQPFSFEIHRGGIDCVVSGTVPSAMNGVFSFTVRVDESDGPANSMKGTQQLELRLDKPYSGGPAASFVYMRTFKLSELDTQS